MDNVANVKALDYSVNFISKYVTNNFFVFGKGLINNIIYNSDLIIVSNLLIA